MRIQVDPSFVEEGVFLAIQSAVEANNYSPLHVETFHSEKNAIYENGKDEESFKKFFKKYFESLGLQAIFENCLSEFPLLNRSDILVFIRRVFSKKEEGSELYLEGGLKTAVLGIQVLRLQDQAGLKHFLRHEFLRISDMLDPYFEYSPEAPLGGVNDAENNLIRERFSELWNHTITSRLNRQNPDSKLLTQKELIMLAGSKRSEGE